MERKTKDLVTQMMTEVKFVPKTTAVTEQNSQALNQNFMSFMDESEPVELAAFVSIDLKMQQYLNDQASNENPLLFLNDHEESFSRLYQVSRIILFAPASTAGIESNFSIAEIIGNRNLRTIDSNFENRFFCNVYQFLVNELDSERAFENV